MAGEGVEPIPQHAGQFPRCHGRAAGDCAHLVDVRLELTQPFLRFGPFGNESIQGALALAEKFCRVAGSQLAPCIEIET